MNIGSALKKIRTDLSFNQKDWSEKIGITQTYISQIENNLKVPSLEVIQHYERVSKVPLAIVLWWAIEEKDIQKSKKTAYKELRPLIDNLIGQVF